MNRIASGLNISCKRHQATWKIINLYHLAVTLISSHFCRFFEGLNGRKIPALGNGELKADFLMGGKRGIIL